MTILLITVVLLLGNAFFVGAEFAAMSARRSQLEPLAEAGDKRAAVAVEALQHTGVLLATCQLGITLCSVLLGAVSEAALHHALHPVMEAVGVPHAMTDAASLVLAILIVVYLHVVVGEMIPKNLAIAGPERSARLLVPPLMMVGRIARPVITGMDRVSKAFVRGMGVDPKDEVSAAFTAEEVQHIVDESHREGLVESEQYGLVGAALEFSDKDAGDVAVRLDQLVTVPPEATPDDVERLVARHGYSRYPTCDDDGEITGYLHLKDVLYADDEDRAEPVPRKRVRRLASVRAGDEVEEVLATMQRTGAHLAQVTDADGEVLGVVFLEDVIEELVGEVADATQRERD
ncbi:hemolysin family protein [Janibacter alkaliphilus]|uniref:CBS domain containing-hemolysin-like protein n=1 Tax=Janibacter alkaliphilus TaxID=1069963 RepID=A0A852X4N0_9MICO|nr:CBS domain containing-hemolysin-like protein [Janibacter alkaliphilus]